MTAKEALQQIKALFSEANVPEAPSAPSVEQFKEYELATGGKVMIDSLEVGGLVTMPAADGGAPVPAPAGEHTLVDGITIQLDENGRIVEISSPEPETPANPELEAMKKKTEEMAAEIAAIKADYEARFAAQAASFEEQSKKAADKLDALRTILEEFFSTPSADPVAPEKFHTSKDDKISRFLERAKNL